MRKLIPAPALALALAVAVAVLALAACSGQAPNQFKQEADKETEAVKLVRDTLKGGYGLLTAAELKALLDAKKDMVIVDTMPFEDSYKKAHVPGAVQFLFPIKDMPEWDAKETGDKTQADFEKLLGPDKGRLVVVYCGFVKCTRSHNGAVWAAKLGYTNVKRFPGGIFAWKGMDYPAEESK